MMQYLAAHPHIAVRAEYPLEATIARKHFTAVVSSLPHRYEELAAAGMDGERLEEELLRWTAENLAEAADLVGRSYAAIHRDQTGMLREPDVYAEKNMSPEWLLWEACANAREIVLVRDPRDIICSSLAFNAKRGRLAFGRQEVETDLDYVAHRAAMARPWVVEPWVARRDRALLVKYEDLVMHPRESLRRLFRRLDLAADDVLLERIIAAPVAAKDIANRHSTAESAVASVGRWRRELPAEIVAACNREFEDFIDVFGYGKT